MAKCPICNSRKGKRKCKNNDHFICSLCCGEIRSIDNCDGCSFFKDLASVRNYKKVPNFSLSEMSNSPYLQDNANVIESALAKFDDDQSHNLNDKIIIKLIELLLDKYHFQDEAPAFSGQLEENGYRMVRKAITEDLSTKSSDEISKLLGTIYRSALRHDGHGRAYIDFIHTYVGPRTGKGMRVLKGF